MKICLQCKIPTTTFYLQCSACNWQAKNWQDHLIFSPELLQVTEQFFNKNEFKNLYKLESTHFWFRARNQLILWTISRYFSHIKNFLEIGCGTGYVISAIQKKLPKLELFAADVFQESLPFVKRRIGEEATIFQMDARNIPFVDEFDLIGAFDVLEHIAEDELVLQQLYQAIKPGGGVILTVPQHPRLWSAIDIAACHVRRYTKNELSDKLIKNGFKIIFSTSFNTFLLPMMLLSRYLQRKMIKQEMETHSNKWMNELLNQILNFERVWIKLGIHFNVGGSRLVVAKKI